jgi:Trp operon repressor
MVHMTNISSKKISDDDYVIAYKQLVKLLSGLHGKNAHFLIEELLTESERVMLVKRFAAIFMFQQNYTSYRVSVTIGISESTAQRLYSEFKTGTYNNLLNCIKKSEKSEFMELLKDLMMSGANTKARARLIKRATR